MNFKAWISRPFFYTNTFFLITLLFFSSLSLAGDIPVKIIDEAELRKYLPENWEIVSIEAVEAPEGWTRKKGGAGVSVGLVNYKSIIPAREGKGGTIEPEHPSGYHFFIMPLDWEGHSDLGNFKTGEYYPKEGIILRSQAGYIYSFYSQVGDFYYFDLSGFPSDLENKFKSVLDYLKNIQI